jgi:hypothetical protein
MRVTALLVGCVLSAGCSAPAPYRDLSAEGGSQCDAIYSRVDQSKDVEASIQQSAANPVEAACWTSTWERRQEFDLFTVEFDDQGWLAGSARDPKAAVRQIDRLIQRLKALTEGPDERQPISLVLYTHGWHHSAAPADGNMVRFRKWLSDTVELERELCIDRRRLNGLPSADPTICGQDEAVSPSLKRRRVVGIYVGWRGDSILGPGIQHASIWDRKLTAEKVALGSVQELYALLHNFWLEHSCHRGVGGVDCVDVRLLTLGHSFGGLITFRGLAPRLMAGVVETYRGGAKGDKPPYAYGFGDLSVLINPAFEGSRYEALAFAASRRTYNDGLSDKSSAQLPALIIAQSKGDIATRTFFPLFRTATTLFERAVGVQREPNLETVGWNSRYITHELSLAKTDPCGTAGATIDTKLQAEAKWYEARRAKNFREFDSDVLLFCNGLVLKKSALDQSETRLNSPAFMPLWNVLTDESVVENHNDYLNVHLLDFVRQIYYTIQRATDRRLLCQPNNKNTAGQCN